MSVSATEEVAEHPHHCHDGSSDQSILEQFDLLVLVVPVGRLDHPVEPLVLLGVVDLAVGAVEHHHGQPLEQAEELVDQKDLQEEEPAEGGPLGGGDEFVDDGCEFEEEVGGEVEDQQVVELEMSEQDVLEVVQEEEPEDFDEEPEDFILSVYAGNVVEVEALYASTTFPAMIFQPVLGDEAFRTDIFHGWKLRCFQQSQKIDISTIKLSLFAASNHHHDHMQSQQPSDCLADDWLVGLIEGQLWQQSSWLPDAEIDHSQLQEQQQDSPCDLRPKSIDFPCSLHESDDALAISLLADIAEIPIRQPIHGLTQIFSSIVAVIGSCSLDGREVLFILYSDYVVAQSIQNLQFPDSVVGGAEVRGVSVHIVIVQAEQEATFPSIFYSLQDRGVSEVISDVPDPILQAPVGGSSIVSRNRLVKRSPIISISLEDYLSAFEVLGERDVHGAQFVQEGFSVDKGVQVDEMQHCQEGDYVVVFDQLLDGIDELLSRLFFWGRVGLRLGCSFWFNLGADEFVFFLFDLVEVGLVGGWFLVEVIGVEETELL